VLSSTQPRFKKYNTPALLAQLDDAKLQVLGVNDKDLRRLVLAAVRKAGYTRPTGKPELAEGDSRAQSVAGPSSSKHPSTVQTLVRPSFSCLTTSQGCLARVDHAKE
jgi:hypothetical protein